MINYRHSVLKKEKDINSCFSYVKNNLFCILNAESMIEENEIQKLFKGLEEITNIEKINSLADFDKLIDEKLRQCNLPIEFSFAAGYLNQKKLYLKTVGNGGIFLKRKNNFAKLISSNNIAAGFIEDNDFFVFTTIDAVFDMGGENELIKIIKDNPDYSNTQVIKRIENVNKNIVAIFLVLNELKQFKNVKDVEIMPQQSRVSLLEKIKESLKKYEGYNQKKKTTIVLVIIIAAIFIWSVGLGYKRKIEASLSKKIEQTKELIIQKTDQAEEVAILNLPRAQILIAEAKEQLNKLKSEIKNSKEKEIKELEEIISQKEAKIIKKEEKTSVEFYDLTIDSKEAKGEIVYLDNNELLILNKEKATIYSLSLEKKSLTKKTFSEIETAKLIAGYQDQIFFLNSAGIYKIGQDGKLKKEIEKDKDWGNIKDMNVFNGNIYLLDTEKDQVYKYLVTETGYSEKTSYFKPGQAISLKGATSFAIDSSLYIGFKDYIIKFTSGLRDGFKTSYPEENIDLIKIFTDKNFENVLGWDKAKGIIYVLDKDGEYNKQVNSKIISSGNDIIGFNNEIYILLDSKIYKISL